MSTTNNKVTSSSLPIINITQDNIAEEWNGLITAVQDCSFIAIDIVAKNLLLFSLFFFQLKNYFKSYFYSILSKKD